MSNKTTNIRSPEHCAKISKANTGKKHTQETKDKLRAITTGLKRTDEVKASISKARFNIVSSTSRRVGVINAVGLEVEYETIAIAARGEGISPRGVRSRCDSKTDRFAHWRWIDPPKQKRNKEK